MRFNGIIKELLPIDESGTTLLENTALNGLIHFKVDEIAVITNELKEQYHKYVLDRSIVSKVPIRYIRQTGTELWGAIRDGIDPEQDTVLLLPDTIAKLPNERIRLPYDFMIGLFITEAPERFSTLSNGKIRTKIPSGVFAWGALYWSADVSKRLLESKATHYDEAFNEIIAEYGYQTFPIYEYYDLGSMPHYLSYLRDLTNT